MNAEWILLGLFALVVVGIGPILFFRMKMRQWIHLDHEWKDILSKPTLVDKEKP